MAAPSQIPGHPQTSAVDSDGDPFPSGAGFFLDNVCSGFQKSLAFDINLPGTKSYGGQTYPDNIGFRWIIEYNGEDRSKISLKNANGGYLATTGTKYGSRMWLSNDAAWWYVYQGDRDHAKTSFWLSSSQSPDAFLHTWDNNGNEGADVMLFTNRDPNSGNFYNLDYGNFEQFSRGLAWRIRPTPEYLNWKGNNQQFIQSRRQQGPCCENCGQKCPSYQQAMKEVEATKAQNNGAVAKRNQELEDKQTALSRRDEELKKQQDSLSAREKKCQETESDVKKRDSTLSGRENDIAAKEKSLAAKEAETKKQQDALSAREKKCQGMEADVKKRDSALGGRENDVAAREKSLAAKEAESKKQQEALSAREEKVRAAEARVKNSKQAGQAEHLASQQESDRLAAENKQLRADLEAAKAQVEDLQRKPPQQQQQQNPSSTSLPPYSGFRHLTRGTGQDRSSMAALKQGMPARSLPKDFNPYLMQRFEAGREAMKRR